MILQLKILKMRKRLFNRSWHNKCLFVALLGIIGILIFALRSVIMADQYGIVSSEIPAFSIPINDPTYHEFRESPDATIDDTTPVVVMTTTETFFGEIKAFSSELGVSSNKFMVRHEDHAPNIAFLIKSMEKWHYQRMNQNNIHNGGVLLFLPTQEIPMPIVIQTLAELKKSTQFKRVILAGGIF